MITAIVQYKLPPQIDLAACAAHYRAIAPDFRDVPGLIRKQFIYAEDGWAGGVYLWQTRAAAEAFYTGPWLDGIRDRYGMDPQIKFFQTACITDNGIGTVLLPDLAEQPAGHQHRLRQSTAPRRAEVALTPDCSTEFGSWVGSASGPSRSQLASDLWS